MFLQYGLFGIIGMVFHFNFSPSKRISDIAKSLEDSSS